MAPGDRWASRLRLTVVLVLHALLALGLIALLARAVMSLRASYYYDPLFDGWTMLLMAGWVTFVVGLLVAAAISWRRSGSHRPVVAVHLFVAGWLVLTQSARVAARGFDAVNAARLLPLAVALVALLAARAVVRTSRGSGGPPRQWTGW
jgi:hypothetical protein